MELLIFKINGIDIQLVLERKEVSDLLLVPEDVVRKEAEDPDNDEMGFFVYLSIDNMGLNYYTSQRMRKVFIGTGIQFYEIRYFGSII